MGGYFKTASDGSVVITNEDKTGMSITSSGKVSFPNGLDEPNTVLRPQGANGFVFSNDFSGYFVKNGVVNLSFLMTTTIPGNFNGQIGKIIATSAPLYEIWFPIFASNGGTAIARGILNTLGMILCVNTTGVAIPIPCGMTAWGRK